MSLVAEALSTSVKKASGAEKKVQPECGSSYACCNPSGSEPVRNPGDGHGGRYFRKLTTARKSGKDGCDWLGMR